MVSVGDMVVAGVGPMNFSALRYFVEVGRCLSIRRASERLHVAASAISRQISALEHELGCVLLERRSDGVRLTEAGLRLKSHAQQMLSHIDVVRSDIDALKSLKRGSLHIATVEGITTSFLPDSIREFSWDFPDIRFEVSVLSRDRILTAIDTYECDLGLVYDHGSHPAIEVISSYRQPLHAFVPCDHDLADGRPVALRQLLENDYVLPDPSFGIHQLVHRVMQKHGIVKRPRIVANNLGFLQHFSQLNGEVFFVPVQAVFSQVTEGLVVPVNLDCKEFENRNLMLAVRRHRVLPFTAESCIAFLTSRFGDWEVRDRDALKQAQARWWKTARGDQALI